MYTPTSSLCDALPKNGTNVSLYPPRPLHQGIMMLASPDVGAILDCIMRVRKGESTLEVSFTICANITQNVNDASYSLTIARCTSHCDEQPGQHVVYKSK